MGSKSYLIGPHGEIGNGHGQSLIHPGRTRQAVTIFNIGPEVVYLETDYQNTDPTAGQPLSVGGSQPWDSNLSLYAACPTQTEIVVSDNSQSPFDPGAIAAQILDQGLAQDIANAIYLTGAPAVDKMPLLDFTTFASNSPAGTTFSSPVLDMSQYGTLALAMEDQGPFTRGNFQARIEWVSAMSGGASLGIDSIISAGGLTYATRADIPVRGPFCKVFYQVLVPNPTPGFNVNCRLYGSYKQRTTLGYTSPGLGSSTGIVDGQAGGGGFGNNLAFNGQQCWNGTMNAGTSGTWQPDICAGQANLVFRFTVATTVTLLVRSPTNLFPLATIRAETGLVVAANTMLSYEIRLAPTPLEISLSNVGAANTGYRVTLDNGNPYNS